LAVVLTDDYLQLGLDAFNREALQAGRPWMLVKPVGGVIWIGPIFHPGKTGCWQCLAQRLRGNREVETTIQQQKEISTPFSTSRSILPSTWQAGLNLAATEIAKWIVCPDYDQLEGKLVTLDLVSLNLQRHILVQRPQCPACGNPASFSNQEPQPLVLVSRKKQFTTDGGHRSFSPEVTLRQYEHHISPITGVVSALFRSSEAENDLVHVYFAAHSFGSDADNLKSLRYALRHKSAGKGKSDQQSRASGLCEAIERYCGLYTGDEIRVKGRYAQLGESAIHPNACMQFSAAQYENRREWNQQHPGFNWVPQPFNEEEEIEWTPVWSLTHQTFKYLPTAFCYYGYPLPKGSCFCLADSNGNAAGNTLEEAILQGFMELVERDSVALWWYNRLKRPAVDLGSFDEPYLQALQDYYKTQQRDLWVLDITSDLNIPVFAAVSRRTDRAIEDISSVLVPISTPKLPFSGQ
jgi:ribosomal protein S12 methylthiotransferase accessory factor